MSGDLFGNSLAVSVSISRQIEAVEREIKLRARVYPRLVAAEKMTQRAANEEILIMQAVVRSLRSIETKDAALRAGLALAEAEEDQRGENDEVYDVKAGETARVLRAALNLEQS